MDSAVPLKRSRLRYRRAANTAIWHGGCEEEGVWLSDKLQTVSTLRVFSLFRIHVLDFWVCSDFEVWLLFHFSMFFNGLRLIIRTNFLGFRGSFWWSETLKIEMRGKNLKISFETWSFFHFSPQKDAASLHGFHLAFEASYMPLWTYSKYGTWHLQTPTDTYRHPTDTGIFTDKLKLSQHLLRFVFVRDAQI